LKREGKIELAKRNTNGIDDKNRKERKAKDLIHRRLRSLYRKSEKRKHGIMDL